MLVGTTVSGNHVLAGNGGGHSVSEISARAVLLLDALGVGAYAKRRPGELSGGQRQRVCLARAIIKRPSALILDEPTSAVDAESEVFIHDALERLQQGKTTLVIAHHFAAMEKFDLILVLKNGCVIEQGTHEQLLERRGRYYRLYQRQVRRL